MTFGTAEERLQNSINFRGVTVTVVIDGSEQQTSIPVQKNIEQSFWSGIIKFYLKICSLPLSLKFSNINEALDRHNKLWTIVSIFTNMFHNFGRDQKK